MLHNLLLLEHETPILVFPVPQGVQKVKNDKIPQPLRKFGTKKVVCRYTIKAYYPVKNGSNL